MAEGWVRDPGACRGAYCLVTGQMAWKLSLKALNFRMSVWPRANSTMNKTISRVIMSEYVSSQRSAAGALLVMFLVCRVSWAATSQAASSPWRLP